MSTLVTIVVPTFRRPDSLKRLLLSILNDISARDDVTIVVADNDVAESARETVETIDKTHQAKIIYTVAPDPGVSNARNAAMAHVSSRYVLFLDDDMEVTPDFLGPLLDASRTLNAAMTFAPIKAVLPDDMENMTEWIAPLFSRQIGGDTRLIDEAMGTGGCLLDLDKFTLPSPVFDPAMNETGGEDDALFAAIFEQGGKSGWCANVTALEHVPPPRATEAYIWSRHFADGQTPARAAADRGLSGLPSILKWMAVGAVQTALHGAAFLFLKLVGKPEAVGQLGRFAQGVGKIFWWDGMSPKLYGANAR